MQIETGQAIFALVVPFVIWVTVSLFNQRQEIALLRVSVEELKIFVKAFRCGVACERKD